MPGTTTDTARYRRRVWSLAEVHALGSGTDIETAASVLSIGRTKAYELAKDGEFPVRLTRVGRRYLVPVAGILRLLGTEPAP